MNKVASHYELGVAVAEQRPSYQEGYGELTPTEVFNKLRRQRGVVFWVFFAGVVFSWLIISQLTPVYTAATKVMIGARGENIIDVEDVLAGISADDVTIESEIHVISSRNLVRRTIDQLGLDRSPEFNHELKPPSALKRFLITNIPRSWQALLEPSSQNELLSNEELQASVKEAVIDEFLAKLEVFQEGESRAVSIRFTSENPQMAAKSVNQLADYYIDSQLDAKYEAAKRAST